MRTSDRQVAFLLLSTRDRIDLWSNLAGPIRCPRAGQLSGPGPCTLSYGPVWLGAERNSLPCRLCSGAELAEESGVVD
jgi:hypothetical protein